MEEDQLARHASVHMNLGLKEHRGDSRRDILLGRGRTLQEHDAREFANATRPGGNLQDAVFFVRSVERACS